VSQVTISGAVSGLDTSSLINQLVSIQANQQALLKTQQTKQKDAADALAKLSSALTTVGSLASSVSATSSWTGTTVTSSSSSVTAAATGTASGTLTVDVTALAAAHALVSATAVGSTASVVASGPLTLTGTDGSTSSIDVGTGTLADVAAAINAAGKGLTALAVQTSPGQYRLQVAASATGASSAFALDGLDGIDGGMTVLAQGADAVVTVGSDPATAYQVASSTNTFAGLLPGVSFTVSKLETGVSLRSKVDGSAVAGQVSKLVDAVNAALAQIASATAYNTSTKSGGALVGDASARSLQQQLLTLVAGAGAPGVSVTRDGTVTFDQTAFTTAFAADPDKVKAAFGATTTFSPAPGVGGTVRFSSSTTKTVAGSYPVRVMALAARERWSLAGGLTTGQVVHVTRGSVVAAYTVRDGDTPELIAAGLSAAAAAAGLGVTAAADGLGALTLTAASAGTGQAFTADVDGAEGVQVEAGADAQGSIDGQAATGLGAILTLTAGTGGAQYLALDTSGLTPDDVAGGGDVGTVTYRPGLAQQLASLVKAQTQSGTGTLSSAKQGRLNSVTSLQDQIDAWDQRLADYRAQLTRQFTAMETALATLKSQTGALSGLSTLSSSS
jgi:flagellar hook-associated protein 2